MRHGLGVLTLGTGILAVLAGCASIPQTHYYLLNLKQSLPQQQAARDPVGREQITIGVKSFTVDSPYDQDQIVYRVGAGNVEVGFYAYHRWAVPLSQMLSNVTAEEFRGMPGVALIEPLSKQRNYSAYLDGRALAFEEVDTPKGQTGYARIWLDLHQADGTRVWSGTFVGEATAHTREVSVVVKAMQSALARALARARSEMVVAIANARLARE